MPRTDLKTRLRFHLAQLKMPMTRSRTRQQTVNVQSRNNQVYREILQEMHPGMTPSELIRLIRVARTVLHRV